MTDVFISPKRNGDNEVYHTDRDCHRLTQANDVQTRQASEVKHKRECMWCKGVVNSGGDQRCLANQLLELDPGDLSL